MSTKVVVFLPGIFGSCLNGPQGEIWPPTARDVLDQKRMQQRLLTQPVTPSAVLRSRPDCGEAYEGILTRLANLARPQDAIEFVEAPYDWRCSVLTSAEHVARFVADTVKQQGIYKGADYYIVAHSMGGLIARLLAERPIRELDWTSRVKGVVTIASPHGGSLDALFGASGRQAMFGLPGRSIRKMVLNGQLDSVLDLLPALRAPLVVERDRHQFRGSLTFGEYLSVYDQALRDRFHQERRARDVLSQLHVNHALCPHLCVASATHKTAVQLHHYDGEFLPIEPHASGDGRVTIGSALLPGAVPVFEKGNHVSICARPGVLGAICLLLGIPVPASGFAGDEADVLISYAPEDVYEDDPFEIYVEVRSDLPADAQLSIVGERGAVFSQRISNMAAWIRDTPALAAGHYEIVLSGDGRELKKCSLLVRQPVERPGRQSGQFFVDSSADD